MVRSCSCKVNQLEFKAALNIIINEGNGSDKLVYDPIEPEQIDNCEAVLGDDIEDCDCGNEHQDECRFRRPCCPDSFTTNCSDCCAEGTRQISYQFCFRVIDPCNLIDPTCLDVVFQRRSCLLCSDDTNCIHTNVRVEGSAPFTIGTWITSMLALGNTECFPRALCSDEKNQLCAKGPKGSLYADEEDTIDCRPIVESCSCNKVSGTVKVWNKRIALRTGGRVANFRNMKVSLVTCDGRVVACTNLKEHVTGFPTPTSC